MTAIYGQLFELGAGGKIIPDLATGYTYSPNAETVTITLRQGVKFSDGTPFNAQAVAYNWNRDLGPTAITNGLNPPWLVAEQKAPKGSPPGTAEPPSGRHPGHRPVHDRRPPDRCRTARSSTSCSTRSRTGSPRRPPSKEGGVVRPEPGRRRAVRGGRATPPTTSSWSRRTRTTGRRATRYSTSITFKTVGSDEAAYEAMLASEGQVYERHVHHAADQPSPRRTSRCDNNLGTSPYDLQLNTAVPPFNNPKARQAIYAATNFAPILQHLFGGRYPTTESFTGPGGICYEQTVPGYQGYDPTLAKQLIQRERPEQRHDPARHDRPVHRAGVHAGAGHRVGGVRAQGQAARPGRCRG